MKKYFGKESSVLWRHMKENGGYQLAKKIVDEGWGAFDRKTMAEYQAEIHDGQVPYFGSITAKNKGAGFGYVVFHHFLLRVGEGNIFYTSLSKRGRRFFKKAVKRGLIIEEEAPRGIGVSWCFRVAGDPMESLRDYVRQGEQKQAPEKPKRRQKPKDGFPLSCK